MIFRKARLSRRSLSLYAILPVLLFVAPCSSAAKVKPTTGSVIFVPFSKTERSAGVWLDGKYIGYVSQFMGRKGLEIPAGNHVLTFREAGYKDLIRNVVIAAGGALHLDVELEVNPQQKFAPGDAELRIHVAPGNAAVYMDGLFAGTVHDFGGIGRSMLAPAGKHTLKISLPGYEDYVVPLDLAPGGKYSIETKLERGSGTQQGAFTRDDK